MSTRPGVRFNLSRRSCSAGVSAALVSFGLVGAAPSGVAAAVQQPQAADVLLAPVEVTVLRTPFLSDQAPFAVAVLTQEDLRRGRSGVFIEEALQRMPGVQVQNRFNPAVGERVMIRGFGARSQFGLRGFRVVVDGIPATLPDGQTTLDHLDIGSLGRVEVMRGPSSALFGNAGGGVLSFSTRAPAAGPFEVEVEGVGGSHGLFRGQATASGTVNGTGYLFSAYRLQADGYREVPETSFFFRDFPEYGEYERVGFNARVTRPLAGGELSLTANVLDLQADNPGSVAAGAPFGTRVIGADPLDNDPFRGVWNTYLVFVTRKEVDQQQGGARWTGAIGGFEGDFSVYAVHRAVWNPIPVDLIDLDRNGGGARAALSRSYSTGAGELEWRAGVDLDLQSDDRKEWGNDDGAPPPGEPALQDQEEKVRGLGVFLQVNLELPGGADALGGLRYDSHRFEAVDRLSGGVDDSGSRTMTAFSPSIGVNVPVGGALNLFGSFSSLFETPTTTELANQPSAAGGFNPNLDPMDGKAYELGVRGDLGSSAAVEVTIYQTDLNNEIIPFEVAGSPGKTFSRNAGTSQHRGFEGTFSVADPTGLFRGDVTFTHTNAEFEDYDVDGEDLGGNKIPGVSPNRLQALARLSPQQLFGGAFAEVVATYMDEVPVNDENDAGTAAPSYTIFDLRAGLDGVSVGGAVLTPWVAVTNLLDEEYIGSVAVNAFGGRFYEPGPPRSFQVGLRATLGGGD